MEVHKLPNMVVDEVPNKDAVDRAIGKSLPIFSQNSKNVHNTVYLSLVDLIKWFYRHLPTHKYMLLLLRLSLEIPTLVTRSI